MAKKKTLEEFIKQSNSVHGNKYDYSKTVYKGNHENVEIICPEHGSFLQRPCHHLNGFGCSSCSGKKQLNTEEFIERCKSIYGDKYDYSLVNYKNMKEHVIIICPTHGKFSQKPLHHINKHECPSCKHRSYAYNTDDFISKSIEVHGNKYDYSKVNYTSRKNKVTIICKKHGEFLQRADDHIRGCGCGKCRSSKGERYIEKILQKNKIEFERQYKFEDCRNKRPLPFDFYIPSMNMCIEYDGQQHYDENNIYHSKQLVINDKIKTKYCQDKGIVLLRIVDQKIDDVERILMNKIEEVIRWK